MVGSTKQLIAEHFVSLIKVLNALKRSDKSKCPFYCVSRKSPALWWLQIIFVICSQNGPGLIFLIPMTWVANKRDFIKEPIWVSRSQIMSLLSLISYLFIWSGLNKIHIDMFRIATVASDIFLYQLFWRPPWRGGARSDLNGRSRVRFLPWTTLTYFLIGSGLVWWKA